jgi:hypothetical protein
MLIIKKKRLLRLWMMAIVRSRFDTRVVVAGRTRGLLALSGRNTAWLWTTLF